VPEKYTTGAYYICNDCLPKYADKLTPGQVVFPDEVFWRLVAEAELEEYGRVLDDVERATKLTDPNSLESKLARDRKALTPGS